MSNFVKSFGQFPVATLLVGSDIVPLQRGQSGVDGATYLRTTVADIVAQASSGAVASVNGQTGAVVLTQDSIPNGVTAKQFTAIQESKLAGIATGATLNSSDAFLLARANHTGVQAIGTVTGLQVALDARQPLAAVLTNTTAAFTSAQESKLAGIAVGAQVNTVTSVAARTGAVTLTKTDVGLGSVDNTSDADKIVSTAQQTALNAKQNSLILTTTGASGAATLLGSTLNIPQYSGGGGGVTSVFTRTGVVVALAGDYTTAQVTESGSLYYTDARARSAISGTNGVSYVAGTGVISPTYGTAVSTIAQGNDARFTDSRAPNGAAGGELSGTYPNPSVTNSSVIAKVLTGLSLATSTAVAAADSILVAIGKLQAQVTLRAPIASPTFTGTVTLPSGQVVNGVTLITGGGTTNFLRADGTYAAPAGGGGGTSKETKTFIFDGQGAVPAVGTITYIYFPYAATINSWTMQALDVDNAPVTASCVLDIWKATYANYPPTVADTITAAAKPAITTANLAQSSALTGWTVNIAAGEFLAVRIDSISTATKIAMFMEVTL